VSERLAKENSGPEKFDADPTEFIQTRHKGPEETRLELYSKSHDEVNCGKRCDEINTRRANLEALFE
jgi:hypothetical protein